MVVSTIKYVIGLRDALNSKSLKLKIFKFLNIDGLAERNVGNSTKINKFKLLLYSVLKRLKIINIQMHKLLKDF